MKIKGKMLIVDDETLICEVIKEAMEADGYYVKSTTNSVDALNYIEDDDFDILITDMCMPDISGIDLLNAVNAKDISTQVILITGYEDAVDTKIIRFLEPFAFVIKPFDLEELLDIVSNALQKKGELTSSKDN